jgi:hypothetical protein
VKTPVFDYQQLTNVALESRCIAAILLEAPLTLPIFATTSAPTASRQTDPPLDNFHKVETQIPFLFPNRKPWPFPVPKFDFQISWRRHLNSQNQVKLAEVQSSESVANFTYLHLTTPNYTKTLH